MDEEHTRGTTINFLGGNHIYLFVCLFTYCIMYLTAETGHTVENPRLKQRAFYLRQQKNYYRGKADCFSLKKHSFKDTFRLQ